MSAPILMRLVRSGELLGCRHSEFGSREAAAIHQAALDAFTARQTCGRMMNKSVGLEPLMYNDAGCLTCIEYQGVYEVEP